MGKRMQALRLEHYGDYLEGVTGRPRSAAI